MFIHLHDINTNKLIYVYMPLIERIESSELELNGVANAARIHMNSGSVFSVRESPLDIIVSIAKANNAAVQAAEAAANAPREAHRGARG